MADIQTPPRPAEGELTARVDDYGLQVSAADPYLKLLQPDALRKLSQ